MSGDLEKIFNILLENSFIKDLPDLHFASGKKPFIRDKSGELIELDKVTIGEENYKIPEFKKDHIREVIRMIALDEGLEKFEKNFELDTSYAYEDKARFRVNCYIDNNGYCIAMRIIPTKAPTMKELGLGEGIKKMVEKKQGLVLVTGPTGSGKSTMLAAMIDHINNNFSKHIITIEDPIEFTIPSKKCLINQREVGNHTKGFEKAMKSALREDPDVIIVGEMRDPETIKAVLTLAETGHLVISTLHTNDTVQSIDRIVDVFPASMQGQIRMQLSLALTGIISQRLIKRKDEEGRIAAREILVNNDAIRNLIIMAKSHQIYSVLEVGEKHGMVLMDKYLVFLFKKGLISKESMMAYARDKDAISSLIKS
ncbi:MAG: type IV pilus twitching motility protein PilT [Candidatus Gracilibacteria bacterium]|nr:type IV pilus twitching motility protein PilT [Candidatus Gracilibacteria bacterium]